MATKLSDVRYCCDGDYQYAGYSSVIGWESKRTRIVRFNFTTGATGATSITIKTQKGTISLQDGTSMSKLPFYVTTSDSSHANALASEGYAVTGYLTKSDGVWSGTANVLLKENTKYYIWFFPYDKTYGWSYWHNNDTYYTTYELSGTSKFTLSVSAGTGSSVTVNRTTSALGTSLAATGKLSNGASVYKGDKLQITFTPSTNYGIDTHTVNGTAFTSGNTHTVSANVNVVATAYLLASDVGATDANIGAKSTITVTKYNANYYHSLQYSFGGLSGYITSSGGVQSSETKFSTASVAFTVPTTFYAKIPNAKTGVCTITCRTYSSSSSTTVLGDPSTCTFTVTATGSPTVSGSIVDTDSTTIALTGNSSTLIRYRSNPKCTITATPKNSASISTVKIRGTAVTGTTGSNGVVTAEKTYSNASYTSFAFAATDSRGYSSSITLNPTVVSYVELTCSPVISRPTPTGSSIVMSVSGALYRGSFGAASNTLTLDYRYKTTDGSYGSWKTIASSSIVLGSSKYTVSNLSLGEDFDYKTSYVFQVRARDGATVNGTSYTLSTVTKTIEVQKGIPIFDWGENDFNVNVALMLSNVNILDIMYPVGAVYMHSSSTLPAAVSGVGTWSSVTTGISGVYAWKRTA